MFDGLKNLGNLPGLLSKAREMQGQMQAMQEELAKKQVVAEAGGGMGLGRRQRRRAVVEDALKRLGKLGRRRAALGRPLGIGRAARDCGCAVARHRRG